MALYKYSTFFPFLTAGSVVDIMFFLQWAI